MSCTITSVKINQCPEVTDLSVNNSLLCKSCCLPSKKFLNVKVDEAIVSGDLVTWDPVTKEASVATSVADIKGVADCSAEATADCGAQICIYVRDALLKCGSINYGDLDPAEVDERLEELRIFLAFQI